MKTIFTFFLLLLLASSSFSQGLSLPYYTGFDSPDEQAGWQQFRTGFPSNFDWENNGNILHDYNVGGNPADTVIDWYVSPSLNFTSSGTVTMKVRTGGFSVPTPDNCEIWFGTNDPDPSTGNFVLIANLSYMQPQNQWLDTIISIPFASDSGYIAFKYKTIGLAWTTYAIDSITVRVGATVGIDEVYNSDNAVVNIFPNPFNSTSIVHFTSEFPNVELNLYNIFGQKVRTINNIIGQEYKLHRDNLPVGVYILRLLEDNKVIGMEKFIIAD